MTNDHHPHYHIRSAVPSDEPFLWEMLYQSLFVEPGDEPFPREIVYEPALAVYVAGWGRPGDLGLIAVDAESGDPIGAVWGRLTSADARGFSYIDDQTPELGLALLPGYRGKGIGTALLTRYLEEAARVYPAVTLSVSPHNPAMRLYERMGFKTVEVRGGHPVMVKHFQ